MKWSGKKRRLASAAVEMAIVTPLLLTLVFGIIEYGWMFTVRSTMATAAREGARTAALPGSNDNDITNRVGQVLSPMGLTGKASVLITHYTTDNPVETVELTVPYKSVSLVGSYFGSTGKTLRFACSMRKEGID